jgi:apolipoprotein N-acyltransferase
MQAHQPENLLRVSRLAARVDQRTGPGQPSSDGPRRPAAAAGGRPGLAGRLLADGERAGFGGWWSLVLAVAAGLALAGAFPPVGVWPLAIAGPGLLVLALRDKRPLAAFGLSLSCGGVFFFGLLGWLVNVAWYAWVTLAVIEALIFAILALALPPLLKLRFWPLAAAGWWVAQEAVRDRFPWGGFPWGRLAMSQASAPTAGWSAIGGPPVLTFLLALGGITIAYLLVRRTARRAALAILALAAVLAGNLAWHWSPGPGPTAVVATIQGDVPHSRNLPDQLRETTVTQNHAAATYALAAKVRSGRLPAPDLVIWPENSTDIDPSTSPLIYQTISLAVAAIDRPVLVGAVLSHPLRNAGQLWLPGRGPVKSYIKRQLVPFGEVIPYRHFLMHFTSLPELQPVNFTPGHRPVVFRLGKIRLGDVICYEVGFDNLVRSEVTAGANLLTVQTNDADFELDGQLGETLQQLQMARMDAITTGRAVAVASTIGISALVDPNGAIIAQSGTWVRAELDGRVPLVSALTPADRAGSWPELAITAATILSLLLALGAAVGSRRSRRADTD